VKSENVMIVPVELARIAISENSQTQVIWLKEKNGTRSFPILIGIFEAWAIERHVKGKSFLRPLTHDLLAGVLTGLKAKLKHIVINDIKDGTFYARLVIEHNGEIVNIDSRPSDAIALATQVKSPIFVEEKVLQSVAAPEGMQASPGFNPDIQKETWAFDEPEDFEDTDDEEEEEDDDEDDEEEE